MPCASIFSRVYGMRYYVSIPREGKEMEAHGISAHPMVFTESRWKFFPIPKATQKLNPGQVEDNVWNCAIKITRTSVSTVRTKTLLPPFAKASLTCTRIRVSASSWLQLHIWFLGQVEMTLSPKTKGDTVSGTVHQELRDKKEV